MSEKKTFELENPITVGEQIYKNIHIMPIDKAMFFKYVGLEGAVSLTGYAVTGLLQACGEFEDSSPLPKNIGDYLGIWDLISATAVIRKRLKEVGFFPEKDEVKIEKDPRIVLNAPLIFEDKEHTHIEFKPFTIQDVLGFPMYQLLSQYGVAMFELIRKYGHFEDGSKIPKGFEAKMHPENYLQCVGQLNFFLMDLQKKPLKNKPK